MQSLFFLNLLHLKNHFVFLIKFVYTSLAYFLKNRFLNIYFIGTKLIKWQMSTTNI